MRILHICKNLASSRGGIQTHTWSLAREMVRLGHEVSILTGTTWMQKQKTHFVGGVQVIPIRYLPGYRLKGLRSSADDLMFNLRALGWLRSHQDLFDVIHVQGRSGILYASHNWRRRTPVVMTLHGLTQQEHWHSRRYHKPSLDLLVHKHMAQAGERRAFKRANRVITVSRFMARSISQRLGDRPGGIDIISNGVYPPTNLPPHKPSRWVTFLGRLDVNKGVQWLPELINYLHPELGIRIIGSGALEKFLRQQIANSPHRNRFDFVGPVPHKDVASWLNKALLLLTPSIYEPQGIVVLEAFSQGIPVVASGVGGLREMVHPGVNGWTVQMGELKEMATRINALHDDPKLARRMGEAGFLQVKEGYTWENIARQTLSLYREMLGLPAVREELPTAFPSVHTFQSYTPPTMSGAAEI